MSRRGPVVFQKQPLVAITRTKAELFEFLWAQLRLPGWAPRADDVDVDVDDGSDAAQLLRGTCRTVIGAACSGHDVDELLELVRNLRDAAEHLMHADGPGPGGADIYGLHRGLQHFVEMYEPQQQLLPTAWYAAVAEQAAVAPDWVMRWMLSSGRGHEDGDTFRVGDGDLARVGLLHPPGNTQLHWIGEAELADQEWFAEALDANRPPEGAGRAGGGIRLEDIEPEPDDAPPTWPGQKEVMNRAITRSGFVWGVLEGCAETDSSPYWKAIPATIEEMLEERARGIRYRWRRFPFDERPLVAVPLFQQMDLYRVYRLAAAIWARLLAPAPPDWDGRDEPMPLHTIRRILELGAGGTPVECGSWTETGRPTTPEQDEQIARYMRREHEVGTRDAVHDFPRLIDRAAGGSGAPCWSVVASLIVAHGYTPPRSWHGLRIMANGILYAAQPALVVAPILDENFDDQPVPFGALDLLSRQLASIINGSTAGPRRVPVPRICQRRECGNYYIRQPPKDNGSRWSTHARGTRYCSRQCADAARQARYRGKE